MLVLTRKPGEKIVIGDNITITVIEICRGRVRLGFDAPKEVLIFREELIGRDSRPRAPARTTAAASPRHID